MAADGGEELREAAAVVPAVRMEFVHQRESAFPGSFLVEHPDGEDGGDAGGGGALEDPPAVGIERRLVEVGVRIGHRSGGDVGVSVSRGPEGSASSRGAPSARR